MLESRHRSNISRQSQGHFPLNFCRCGEEVEIVAVLGGKRVQARIHELGLLPGTIIKVLRADRCVPFLIHYRGCNLALGNGIAHHLLVRQKNLG
jgi:ferrous iron transport protein A